MVWILLLAFWNAPWTVLWEGLWEETLRSVSGHCLSSNAVASPGALMTPPEVDSEQVLQIALPEVSVRRETFELVPSADPSAGAAAVMRLLRVEGRGFTLLERDIVFRVEGWRLHHTERLIGSQRQLTAREQGPTGALCWTADWDLADPTGGRRAEVLGHGWRRPTHGVLQAAAPWIGPLEWSEIARVSALPELGPVAWLRPVSVPSGVAVTSHLTGSTPPGPEGRLTFDGRVLVGCELGSGTLGARPISEAQFADFVERHGHRPVARHPLVEAALHREETLRTIAELHAAGFAVRY